MPEYRAKLFFDLDKARQFGDEVEKIAKEITIQTGKKTWHSIIREVSNPDKYPEFSIFGRKKNSINPLVSGEHHHIVTEKNIDKRDIYYVEYHIADFRNVSRVEQLQAQRQADTYLNSKYKELAPNIGISRA